MDAPTGLNDFLAYHRRMSMLMLGICIAVVVALVVLHRADLSWAGGFALGAAARLLKFRYLDLAVVKKMALENKDAASIQVKSMAVWMGLFGAAALTVFSLRLNIWAMVGGLFLPPVLLVVDTWLRPGLFAKADANAVTNDIGEE